MIRASRRPLPYDFAVYDAQGQLLALVEAKRRFAVDRRWAREWHEMAVARTAGPGPVTVVFVSPDRIYGWLPGAGSAADPDWDIDAKAWLAPYFERLRIDSSNVFPSVFEDIVGMWLRDVSEGDVAAKNPAELGLLDALRGGEVVQQVAA